MDAWWKNSVVYQIYPRSFKDSNGDGIGDLRGITEKLDYLHTLGVDVIWLCPVYQSGGVDGGYDISDYRAIEPEFGSMRDWEDLLAGMHARGMKLIMDLVVNHTSDGHPWFVEARKSKDNPYRDYYIWREGKDGGPPSNWGSHFGGSAWQLDPQTGEYYLHLFATEQPDLNWENPQLRREVFDMMRFWLDKGIDGFRMDTINMLSKVPHFPDTAQSEDYAYPLAEEHFLNGPRLMEYLREMRTEVLDHYDTLTVGETPGVDPDGAAVFTDPQTGPLSMIFQFDHMALDKDPTSSRPRWTHVPWQLPELKRLMSRWQDGLYGRGWNSLYLSNHDIPRLVSRYGDDGQYRVQSAKLLATMLHTLQGTPYIYQGDEIGMTNAPFTSIDDYRDVDALNFYREEMERGESVADTLKALYNKGRDNARTPMPWDGGANGGFSTGTPWIKLNPNFEQINVQAALSDPDSIFWYYRDLIKLRRAHPAIVEGKYELLLPEHPQVYAYTRTTDAEKLLVLLNFSGEVVTLDWPLSSPAGGELLIGNYSGASQLGASRQSPVASETAEAVGDALKLRPWEARVYRV